MDLHPSEDMYDSFQKYQTALLAQFENLVEEFQFEVVDASQDIPVVFEKLRAGITRVLGEKEQPSLEAVATQVSREAEMTGDSRAVDNNGTGS